MRTLSIFLFLVLTMTAAPVAAFCGFFVGNTQDLYNDATQVVMMRKGTTTVLSMRPDYEGPVKDFALVIPVPEVLEKADVQTLRKQPFDAVDKLSAPRLVEYREMNPCHKPKRTKFVALDSQVKGTLGGTRSSAKAAEPKVRVKAKFARDEYEIVILDADESLALKDWLVEHGYKLPKGASKYLAPYIEQGMYFFAAKVDADKVDFEDGKAVLSPIQFRYDSDDFRLPIRLGLLNAQGKQDLIVFILADSRYEVANRRNLFIPTNVDVSAKRKEDFGEWYDDLFGRTIENRERSAVTEYVWPTTVKCDPCPPGVTMLGRQNLAELGGALMSGKMDKVGTLELESVEAADDAPRKKLEKAVRRYDSYYRRCARTSPASNMPDGQLTIDVTVNPDTGRATEAKAPDAPGRMQVCLVAVSRRMRVPKGVDRYTIVLRPGSRMVAGRYRPPRNLILTRLHLRYGKKSGTDDLVFEKAKPVVGGREVKVDGELEKGARKAKRNAFQARYAIRHRWHGPVECENPVYGRWKHQTVGFSRGMPTLGQ